MQPVAEHGFDGGLEPRRHLEEVGDRPDDPGELGGGALGEDRAYARAVSLALALEPLQGLALGLSRGEPDPQLRQ